MCQKQEETIRAHAAAARNTKSATEPEELSVVCEKFLLTLNLSVLMQR